MEHIEMTFDEIDAIVLDAVHRVSSDDNRDCFGAHEKLREVLMLTDRYKKVVASVQELNRFMVERGMR